MVTKYTSKVDAVVAQAGSLDFTDEDFADLAIAAADQAGMSADDQAKFRERLDWAVDRRPIRKGHAW